MLKTAQILYTNALTHNLSLERQENAPFRIKTANTRHTKTDLVEITALYD